MLMPRIFDDDFFDDWMRWPVNRSLADTEKQLYGKNAPHVMKTDIHEHDDHYDVDIDLPGFKKDEIELSLEKGYLTVSATKGLDKDETDKKGRLIGLAFDGNWEAMSSDLKFDTKLQRCIGVDIRYVLSVIEKYGKAKRLIKELTLE